MEYGEVWINSMFDAAVMILDDPVGRMPASSVTMERRTQASVTVMVVRYGRGRGLSLRIGETALLARFAFGSGARGGWIREERP